MIKIWSCSFLRGELRDKRYLRIVGGISEGVTPLTIPNKEVKSFSADGTALGWESRSLPSFFYYNIFKER